MGRPRIVIVGGGFGGLWAAKALKKADADVIVIDRTNHHLFQPLLYQVATAGLSPANIAAPIRGILSRQKNVEVMLAEVVGIDLATREVLLRGDASSEGTGQRVAFDHLILATGARHSYFGHPEWEPHAPGLKTLEDATRIRREILLAFERAELASTEAEKKAWLTFAIVGGGPTGVELAGSIAELAHRALACDFDHIDIQSTRILLIEAGPRILATFSEKLSRRAVESLRRLGVEVLAGTPATAIDADGLTVGNQRIEAKTILWAAGVAASPVGNWLGVETDRVGRVAVGPTLEVPGLKDVFVIGDAALRHDEAGRPLPGVCQTAMQEGAYVGKLLRRRLEGRPDPPGFRYWNKGEMATIGRKAAIAKVGRFEFSGYFAWLLWLFIHLLYLIGFANRLLVMVQWTWAYVTFQRGARLITFEPGSER